MPIVQTSRLCPYTCAFCVSGKNRGKLRAFPIEQVREELHYICRRYADRPEFTMYIADENFGILKRDVEVAQIIRDCAERYGYPRKVFFYNDKRFTETSREVHKLLGHMDTLLPSSRTLTQRFPEVDAFVAEIEGEAGFHNIVSALLFPGTGLADALDGVAFGRDGNVVQGLPVGLSTDLDQLDSPYLSGILDPFLDGEFLPIVQTSRLCPYTCAFCVSGKNRGKLRDFPRAGAGACIDICQRVRRPTRIHHATSHDGNFGILKRDVERCTDHLATAPSATATRAGVLLQRSSGLQRLARGSQAAGPYVPYWLWTVDSATYNILWVVGACCVVRPSSDWNAAIGAWHRLKRNTNSLT